MHLLWQIIGIGFLVLTVALIALRAWTLWWA